MTKNTKSFKLILLIISLAPTQSSQLQKHCQVFHYLDKSTNLCTACNIEGCLECKKQDQDSTPKCLSCIEGTYLDKSSGTCKICPIPRCLKCTSSECLECQNGFFSSAGKCRKCQLFCLKCDSLESCKTCRNGFYLDKEKLFCKSPSAIFGFLVRISVFALGLAVICTVGVVGCWFAERKRRSDYFLDKYLEVSRT